MTRGVAHPPELRAEVIAAVLAGMSVVQAAARYGLDKGLVSRWVASVATQPRTRGLESIEEMLVDLVGEHISTIRVQLQAAARPEWLEKQSAAELAQLLGAEQLALIRLLAGFRPVADEQQRLAEPADAAPDPGADSY